MLLFCNTAPVLDENRCRPVRNRLRADVVSMGPHLMQVHEHELLSRFLASPREMDHE